MLDDKSYDDILKVERKSKRIREMYEKENIARNGYGCTKGCIEDLLKDLESML